MLRQLSRIVFSSFGNVILRPPRTLVKVDLSKSPENQPIPLHNRWHPEIPAVARVFQGEVFRL